MNKLNVNIELNDYEQTAQSLYNNLNMFYPNKSKSDCNDILLKVMADEVEYIFKTYKRDQRFKDVWKNISHIYHLKHRKFNNWREEVDTYEDLKRYIEETKALIETITGISQTVLTDKAQRIFYLHIVKNVEWDEYKPTEYRKILETLDRLGLALKPDGTIYNKGE